MYQVNEIFDSVQGEGRLAGMLSTFIRLQGCSVGCPWCDSGPLSEFIVGNITRNTWGKGGTKMTVEEIVSRVTSPHVVITGGEPTIYDLDPLLQALIKLDVTTQLETSGQNELKSILPFSWITWSPKKNLDYKAPQSLMDRVNEVKWVVDRELPLDVITQTDDMFVNGWNQPYVVLMPEGSPPSQDSIERTLAMLRELKQYGIKKRLWFGGRMQYWMRVR